MKQETVKNAIDAHGWVGLFISVPLFIIFWAGAITLFYPEVYRWSAMPHFPLSSSDQKPTLNSIVESQLEALDMDISRRIIIRLPDAYSPYLKMLIPVFDDEALDDKSKSKQVDSSESDKNEPQHRHRAQEELTINPNTGEILLRSNPFNLANFLNQLHFSFKLPQGLYIAGLVTFFFAVIVITGVIIQLKNLIRHFFLYRHNKHLRYQMNDLHNVVGVVSLPYTVMYALTGLMFNLHILFEVPTLFLKYQGDTQVMMQELGFEQPYSEPLGINYLMPDLDGLIQEVENEQNANVTSLSLRNFGDQNAVISLSGHSNTGFAKEIERVYEVSTASFPPNLNTEERLFLDGLEILGSLHFGDFAGVDMRVLYFLLALGVCGMIVAGNVLWIAKRQDEFKQYPKTIAATRCLTLGGCMGVILATAVAFFLERFLPMEWTERSDWVMYGFVMALLVCTVWAFFNSNYKSYISSLCLVTALFLFITLVTDSLLFAENIFSMAMNGYPQTMGVSIALAISACIFAYIGITLRKRIIRTSVSLGNEIVTNST